MTTEPTKKAYHLLLRLADVRRNEALNLQTLPRKTPTREEVAERVIRLRDEARLIERVADELAQAAGLALVQR